MSTRLTNAPNKALCLSLLVVLAGCAHSSPNLRGELWAGSSQLQDDKGAVVGGIERRQDKQAAKCSEPSFDQMVCLKWTDFSDLLKACKQWY